MSTVGLINEYEHTEHFGVASNNLEPFCQPKLPVCSVQTDVHNYRSHFFSPHAFVCF